MPGELEIPSSSLEQECKWRVRMAALIGRGGDRAPSPLLAAMIALLFWTI